MRILESLFLHGNSFQKHDESLLLIYVVLLECPKFILFSNEALSLLIKRYVVDISVLYLMFIIKQIILMRKTIITCYFQFLKKKQFKRV